MSLLIVGSLHLDVVLRAPHLPGLDETVTGSSVDYVFGGKGGNQTIAAARMGAYVHFAGRAGNDRFGDMIRETLEASGAELSQLQRDPGPSGMSAAIVNADGDYGAVIVSAANLNVIADQVVVPDGVSLVVLQNEIPQDVNLAVARKAKAAGAQVWLNAAPTREIPDGLVEAVDLLIVNRVEAEFYADLGPSIQTLKTLGANGVSFQGDHTPGYQVDVISTHGAGDMFVGALAALVADGRDISEAIGFAQAAAALHVASGLDARTAISKDDVAAFMKAQARR